jgi:hypothetical protein
MFKKLVFFVSALTFCGVTYSQKSTSNHKEIISHIRTTAMIVAIPNDKTFTNNDWGVLPKVLPKAQWKQGSSKNFSEVRQIAISKESAITAKGARTMISAASYEHNTSEPLNDIFALLKSVGTILEQRCDPQESVSFRERYFVISLPGHRPLKGVFEFSSGSALTSQTITFSNELNLPPIGSNWTSKC